MSRYNTRLYNKHSHIFKEFSLLQAVEDNDFLCLLLWEEIQYYLEFLPDCVIYSTVLRELETVVWSPLRAGSTLDTEIPPPDPGLQTPALQCRLEPPQRGCRRNTNHALKHQSPQTKESFTTSKAQSWQAEQTARRVFPARARRSLALGRVCRTGPTT